MTVAINPPKTKKAPKQKTGRRPSEERATPRDKTICFMVSEDEKVAVDTMGVCMRLTRSAILAKIISLYLESTDESKSENDHKASEKELLQFIKKGREALKKTPKWQKQLANSNK